MCRAAARALRSGCFCLGVLGSMILAMPMAVQAATTARSDAEIRALIAEVARSGCRFQRNGRWHEATQAQAHLQRKYDWAMRKGLAGSAEDFIAGAASRSSLSGRAYRIACPGEAEAEAGPWFSQRLARLRAHVAPR